MCRRDGIDKLEARSSSDPSHLLQGWSVKIGPKFRLNDVQRPEARQRLANGEPANHLAKVYSVSRATIYRVCLQERAG